MPSTSKNISPFKNESGFVLVLALLILVVLVVIGLSTTKDSQIGLLLSRNDKLYKQNFYGAEGASTIEANKVGRSSVTWYQVTDPGDQNQLLVPTAANYLPAGYTFRGTRQITAADSPNNPVVKNYLNWPVTYLNPTQNQSPYSYLVTYLYPDTPPKGYDASQFSGYKFRINGEREGVIIDIGGIKVGIKSSM